MLFRSISNPEWAAMTATPIQPPNVPTEVNAQFQGDIRGLAPSVWKDYHYTRYTCQPQGHLQMARKAHRPLDPVKFASKVQKQIVGEDPSQDPQIRTGRKNERREFEIYVELAELLEDSRTYTEDVIEINVDAPDNTKLSCSDQPLNEPQRISVLLGKMQEIFEIGRAHV